MFSAFAHTLKIPELRKRVLFTVGMIFLCRLISCVPVPFVDGSALQRLIDNMQAMGGGLFGWMDLFSGGALSNCAVGAMGIMPYISASIILQLMTAIIPSLERLAREGDVGRQKLTQYTRYFTLVICVIQGLMLARVVESPGAFGLGEANLVNDPGWPFRIMFVIATTTGTMMLMWLGEQITDRGIGNGISMVITIGIVSRLPQAVVQMVMLFRPAEDGSRQFNLFHLLVLMGLIFLVTAGTIALTLGQRKVPIHTTKRVVGRKVYGGQNTYMPLRVNYSGVMPIIFSSALLVLPVMLLTRMPASWEWAHILAGKFIPGNPFYLIGDGILILFFSYFWVATQFNPVQIADDLKRSGGYVPGIRPGRPTAEYLDKVMARITLMGALFLTMIAVLPSVLSGPMFNIPWAAASFFGGTSLLIIVGVTLDTMRQVEAHLLMRNYDGFLKKGKLRGRY